MRDPSDRPDAGTTELETADLLQLAQRGTIEVDRRPTERGRHTSEPRVVVDLAPAKTPRGTARITTPSPRRGHGLVIVVYAIATAALAASIYLRWFA